ncbi:MAG: hypothetical protein ACOC2W_02190 [bacterium]
MKKDSKQRLFEVMGKLNPNFRVLNESEDPCWDGYQQYGTKEKDGNEVPNCVPINEEMPDDANTDVEMLKNLKTPALDSAREKIHTQQEFDDAFEYWFSTLGVANEYKDRINITTSLSHIREVLEKFGVKN